MNLLEIAHLRTIQSAMLNCSGTLPYLCDSSRIHAMTTAQKRLMSIARDISRRKTQFAKRNLILKWCQLAKQFLDSK